MEDLMKPIVVVTGFGPFEGHEVNASWESVKILPKELIESENKIELVTLQIPVVYRNVDEFIPEIWDVYTPKLVIHVGVAAGAQSVVLETVAYRNNYVRCDSEGYLPTNGQNCCVRDSGRNIKCGLNVAKLSKDFNKISGKVSAISMNAGRYLCEYIYYTSLSINKDRVLFVHVPDLHISRAEDTAELLSTIIRISLEQIDECECNLETVRQ